MVFAGLPAARRVCALTALRLAVGNIHRPGALTPSVVLSLGLGLTLMVAIALIDGNLRRQVTENIPAQAPDFFFVDIQNKDMGDFTKLVRGIVPDGKLTSGPMLRGRIVAFNGQNVRDMKIPPEAAWVLRGDRGITFAEKVPENATLSEGAWWPADYSGEPLVSLFRARRQGAWPEAWRQGDGQCAWPQHHRENRQLP